VAAAPAARVEDREPVTPLTALRRHWGIGLVLVIGGTLVGAGVGAALPASYTAESRIAVGSNDLVALSIPGYAYAAGELAASTARYVDNSQALGALAPVLGEDADQITDVTASPIPQSNIIRVEVTAGSEDVATRGTAALTDYLIEQSSRVNSASDVDQLLGQYAELSREVAEVSAARDRAVAAVEQRSAVVSPSAEQQAALVDLEARLSVLQARQGALQAQYENAVTSDDLSYQLVTVAEAAPSFDNSTSQVQRYGLLGLVAGLLAALLAAVLLERRRRTGPQAAVAGEDVRDADQQQHPDDWLTAAADRGTEPSARGRS